jgi:hypothetical protein
MLRSAVQSLQSVGFEADAGPMSRRLAPALLSVLALVAFPAAASAQAARDARAFADIGIRATAAIAVAAERAERGSDAAPRCHSDRRLARRGGERAVNVMYEVYTAHWIAAFARAADVPVAQAAADLQAVHTTDPILRSGRTGWRRVHRMYSRVGALEPVRFCSLQRDYVRGGFRNTPEITRARRTFRLAMNWDTSDIDSRLDRAVKRLVELGIPAADADAFNGQLDEN